MNNKYYPMIFKRKSFHLFRNVGNDKIEPYELSDIETAWNSFESLYPDTRTAIRIVSAEKVHFKRDAEYCIMLYSEKKENYLMNIGYLGEQLDLYLVSRNIGTLWFGIGRPDEKTYNGLEYVIMIAIHKIGDETLFRKDMFKSKRKRLEEEWEGDTLEIADIARFSPSACNTQPWYVKNDGKTLTVFRYKKAGKRGIMPVSAVLYFNRIDIGIYLSILEICMAEKGIEYSRELFADMGDEKTEFSEVAVYQLL
ncbi:MAG: nitroreductase [Firmicutes bacterium]|nr:nitroreductase [Bacillota bacterium]